MNEEILVASMIVLSLWAPLSLIPIISGELSSDALAILLIGLITPSVMAVISLFMKGEEDDN